MQVARAPKSQRGITRATAGSVRRSEGGEGRAASCATKDGEQRERRVSKSQRGITRATSGGITRATSGSVRRSDGGEGRAARSASSGGRKNVAPIDIAVVRPLCPARPDLRGRSRGHALENGAASEHGHADDHRLSRLRDGALLAVSAPDIVDRSHHGYRDADDDTSDVRTAARARLCRGSPRDRARIRARDQGICEPGDRDGD